MDLKQYYQKIREIETGIREQFVVVESLETPDGGKAGTYTEVAPKVAAKMVVDRVARLVKPEAAKRWREEQAEAQRAAEQAAAAGKVQLSVVPTDELNRLKAAALPPRE